MPTTLYRVYELYILKHIKNNFLIFFLNFLSNILNVYDHKILLKL